MIVIPIGNHLRLVTTAKAWRIDALETRNDVTSWAPRTWHTSLNGAMQALRDLRVATTALEPVAEAIEVLNTSATKLTQALTPRIRGPEESDD